MALKKIKINEKNEKIENKKNHKTDNNKIALGEKLGQIKELDFLIYEAQEVIVKNYQKARKKS